MWGQANLSHVVSGTRAKNQGLLNSDSATGSKVGNILSYAFYECHSFVCTSKMRHVEKRPQFVCNSLLGVVVIEHPNHIVKAAPKMVKSDNIVRQAFLLPRQFGM